MENQLITLLVVLTGFLLFSGFLLRIVSAGLIDIFDAIIMSFVVSVPLLFLTFGDFSIVLSHLIGVEYPFVIMFGILFFIVFMIFVRVFIRLNSAEKVIKDLTQEIAIERIKPAKKVETHEL